MPSCGSSAKILHFETHLVEKHCLHILGIQFMLNKRTQCVIHSIRTNFLVSFFSAKHESKDLELDLGIQLITLGKEQYKGQK